MHNRMNKWGLVSYVSLCPPFFFPTGILWYLARLLFQQRWYLKHYSLSSTQLPIFWKLDLTLMSPKPLHFSDSWLKLGIRVRSHWEEQRGRYTGTGHELWARFKKCSLYYDKWSRLVLRQGRENDCGSSGCCGVSAIVFWSRQVCRKPSLSLTLGFSLLALCLKKTQTKLSFPTAVGLAHQLDDSSDKMHRHLFREITTSPSKENLSQAETPTQPVSVGNSFMPRVCDSPGLSVMSVLGSALHALLVMNNYLTNYQTHQTGFYARTPQDASDQRLSQGWPSDLASTWVRFKFGPQLQHQWETNPTCSSGFHARSQCLLIAVRCCV